ncbi:MAG: type II secretion system protein [Candidatus Omnitrophica bacterium]|nr:type II secretion system protein [Candidatus Omnitrophota bacterium]
MRNKKAFTLPFAIPCFLYQGRRGTIKKPLGKSRSGLSSGRSAGFTLIEIMITVGIILILALILMPNMIRTKLNTNESTAIMACKTIHNGLSIYVLQQEEFPASLSAITIPLANPPFIESHIANAASPATSHNGYWFKYAVEDDGTGFALRAHPKNAMTGKRHFFINENGIVHHGTSEDVSETDPRV